MAALTSATVIVEASDSSGALHQAKECQRLGRWLFILKSVVDSPGVDWPNRYSRYERARIISSATEAVSILRL